MKNRITYSILAALVALSLIVTGVWAWIDNSQHKSNIATGGNEIKRNDVVLIEDYEEPDDWKQEDELTKKISVKNTGEGEIYVRLQLKEYMEIAHVDYQYHPGYYLVNKDGQFVTATSVANMETWLAANMPTLDYDPGKIVQRKAYGVTGDDLFYLQTDENTNVNGVYGKQLLESFTQDDAATSLVMGVEKGVYNPTPSHNNLECKYTPHLWAPPLEEVHDCGQGDDGTDDHCGFHDYVEWKMGTVKNPLTNADEPAYILMSAWDGEPVAKWILDDMSATKDEGWVYWGEALQSGVETAYLLESITLIQQPSGQFYYAIHVDMEAADIYQAKANFKPVPTKIAQCYGIELDPVVLAVAADKATVKRSGTIAFTATWNGEEIPAASVRWTFEKITTPGGVGKNTVIDEDTDILTIGGQQSFGIIRATATYNSPDGDVVTESLEFTVVA